VSTSLPTPMQRGSALFLAFALALGALLPLAAPATTRAAPTELFFSEYVEGLGQNQAVEIYNGTGAAVDLSAGDYSVRIYFQGSSAAGVTIDLEGIVAVGDVFVLSNSAASAAVLAQADQTAFVSWFDGDDAVALAKGGTLIDVVGQIGLDPGTEWGSGVKSTADNTLRRKVGIEGGDANGSDAFAPAEEWDGLATDTFGGLGAHAIGGAGGAGIVISEFRVRGPNGAADEFVELHNASTQPIAIGGWLLRGSNATAGVSTRATIADSVVVGPGCFYLVTNSSSSGGPYSGSVVGDATFATGITDDGGIAITRPEFSVVDAVGMSTGSAYVEGTPLAPLSGTGNNLDQGYERKPGGSAGHATNTGDNASDFALIAPSNPQSSSSSCIGETPVDAAPAVSTTDPADGATAVPGTTNISVTFSEPVAAADGWYTITCTTSGAVTATVTGGPTTWTLDPDVDLVDGETCTVTIVAANVTDIDVEDPPDNMAADHVFSFTVGNICETPSHSISQIQGTEADSPFVGQTVSLRGVVTADFTSGGDSGTPSNQGLRGFFVEAGPVDRDDDPLSSEGIFVFDFDGVFAGAVGDVVAVRGSVSEFSDVTQVSGAEIRACELEIELPAAAALPLPLAPADRNETLEPLESMRVTHPELTVTEFFQLERFGEIRLSADGVLQTPTNVHVPLSSEAIQLAADNAAATIILDDGRSGQNLNLLDNGDDYLPYVRAGDTLRIGDQLLDHTAVLHFGFGAWRLQPVDINDITDELAANRTRPRDEIPPEVGGNLKVASFNVLNYFDGDGQGGGFPTSRGAVTPSELARQTENLVDAITRLGADVYGLIEIENDGGEFQATRTLVDALNAEMGSEVYRFVDTGVIGTDEIKQAFIYDRRTVRPVGDWAILTSAVDPRFDDDLSRPALAQSFVRLGSGERVTVVVNHLKSKGQSGLEDPNDPNFDQGDGQGFWNAARTEAAEALADWVASNPTGENVVGALIIGDLNAYGREDPIRALEAEGFEDQLVRHTEGVPYTFTFDGMQGTLDTALATDALASRVTGAAVWHINADEVPAIDYLESFGGPALGRFRTAEIAEAYYDPSAFRSSDHDPVLIGLDLGVSRHARNARN